MSESIREQPRTSSSQAQSSQVADAMPDDAAPPVTPDAESGGGVSTATDAELSNAELSNAELSNAELSNAELSNTELPNTELPDAGHSDAVPPQAAAGSSDLDDEGTDPSEPGFPEPPDDTDSGQAPISGEALLVQEGEIAGDYLEQLLDILDYDGDIDLDVEGSRAIVAIVGANDLDPLVGTRGVTLDALQELTRLTVAQQTGVRTRLMLDIGGYRAGRRTELSELAATSVTRVIDTGETLRMNPMNAFERKIVHDVVTAADGVHSESEGEDPDRRVVILPDR